MTNFVNDSSNMGPKFMEINRSQNLNFQPFLLPIFESKEKNVRNKNQLQIQRFAINLFEIQKIDSSLNRSQI